MQRRKFLRTVGTVAPGALAAPLVHAASSRKHNPKDISKQQEPRVFFFDDGRHAADLYCFEPPVTPEDHTFIVDQLASSGVDALVYFASVEGGSALYDSKAVQVWGAEVKKWIHYVWYRAGRILRQLIDDGHDPLKLFCDRCHETGILMIASGWVSLHGGLRERLEGLGRSTAFTMDNPQFQVGDDPDSRAKGNKYSESGAMLTSRFSFLHEKVRQERLRLFEEMLTDYETDGIELNLTDAMPYCKFSEADRLAPIMTQWIRDLRAIADMAQEKQGRKKRIYARIPAHPDAWKLVGYEVSTWISENLVDGFFCESSHSEDEGLVQDFDCKPVVNLAKGSKCRVYSILHNVLGRQFARYATPPMIYAGVANAYDQGVDGIAMGDHLWTPNGWPWTAQEYDTLRLLGHPELLATTDKYYMVRSPKRNGWPSQDPSKVWLPGRSEVLPIELEEGETIKVSFAVADTIEKWRSLGRLKSVVLRVRFANIISTVDEVKVEFNSQVLPDSLLQKVDFTYRLVGQESTSHSIGPYGYAYDFHLSPKYGPKHGRNEVKVTVLKRDRNIEGDLSLVNVDCRITYRLHRHFEDRPIEY